MAVAVAAAPQSGASLFIILAIDFRILVMLRNLSFHFFSPSLSFSKTRAAQQQQQQRAAAAE